MALIVERLRRISQSRIAIVPRLRPSLLYIGILVGYLGYRYGSSSDVVARLRGRPLNFRPTATSIKREGGGEVCVIVMQVRNLTSRSVRLLGAKTFCGCVRVDDFPLAIQPNSTQTFHVKLSATKNGWGRTDRVIEVYSDHPSAFSSAVALSN